MEHKEFIDSYQSGHIGVGIDRSEAMHVCDEDSRIPKPKRIAHMLWSNACMIALIGGPVSIFWYPWYVGIGIFIVLGLMGGAAVRTSACSFVRETALEDPEFYQDMLESGVINLRPLSPAAASS